LLITGSILCVGLLVVLLKERPPSVVEVAQSVPDVSGAERVEAFAAIDAEAVTVDDAALPSETEATSGHLDSVAFLEQEALLQLLPSWMHDEGADFHFEQTEVVGEPISRCRGRYKWDDGASMEYELKDIGGTAKPDLIQSFGFNFNQGYTEDATGYRSALETDEGVLINHEYDESAGEGSLQILVNDRFLLEVQLEGFEAEAFEDVLENHLPLDALLRF
jgi:hypothetical protein